MFADSILFCMAVVSSKASTDTVALTPAWSCPIAITWVCLWRAGTRSTFLSLPPSSLQWMSLLLLLGLLFLQAMVLWSNLACCSEGLQDLAVAEFGNNPSRILHHGLHPHLQGVFACQSWPLLNCYSFSSRWFLFLQGLKQVIWKSIKGLFFFLNVV